MAIIVPAILEETKAGFQHRIFQAMRITGVQRIQVDFGDGEFVPHKTFDIKDLDPLNPAFEWEAHLMIKDPGKFLDYHIAGFKTLIVHYEAFANGLALEETINKIEKSGLKAAIAINPETDPKVLSYFNDRIKQFTVLGVQPGFQGHPFLPETTPRVQALRAALPDAILEVDGGVSAQNASALVLAGADYLVVGSALFETENVQENYNKIQHAMNNTF